MFHKIYAMQKLFKLNQPEKKVKLILQNNVTNMYRVKK